MKGTNNYDQGRVFEACSTSARPAPKADSLQLLMVVAVTSAARFSAVERVLTQESKNALLLLAVDSGMYFSLEGVGRRVWELCDGSHTVEEIVDDVCSGYDAPREVIDADVRGLIGELAGERLLAPAVP
jgi:hypothetical protein